MHIYNLKERLDFLDEVFLLEYNEWARLFPIIYLKNDLVNYYDKFSAIFIKKLNSWELLYKFD